MVYSVYLDGVMLPVTPSLIKSKYKSENERISLIQGRQVTFLREGETPVITVQILLPRRNYPFCRYESGYKDPEYYLDKLKTIRNEKRPFRFICTRTSKGGTFLDDTNMRFSLEDMTVSEDAKEGSDITVTLEMREYKEYMASRVIIESTVATVEDNSRETDNAPTVITYTVVKGDSLWNIAKKYLGNGSRWQEIYELNTNQISNPNLIYPGQVLIMPS